MFNWIKKILRKSTDYGEPSLVLDQSRLNYLFCKKLGIKPAELLEVNCNIKKHGKKIDDFYREIDKLSIDKLWELAETEEERASALRLREMYNDAVDKS